MMTWILTIIRDISDCQNLHTSIIFRGMKIFFDKAVWMIVPTLLVILLFASCSKKNEPVKATSMAEAFLKAQSATPTVDTTKKTALERLTFNQSLALTDSGSKVFNERKAIEIVRDLETGWNLGNTFDATGGGGSLKSETSWGQPKTTQAMIEGLAASGIKTLRIPVSWSHHISDTHYTIDTAWMARVKEVADWAIDAGMYVIINIHHDNYDKDAKMPAMAGFYPTDENYENSADFVCNIWGQISLAFNNGYDEHLIFEALNEPRLCGTNEEWWYNAASSKSRMAMENLNKLNQNILDVIRASGGNNQKRLVAFPSLQASPDSALATTFKMPRDYDGSKDRLIVSVHMYTPYNFAMESPGITEYSEAVKKEFTSMFKRLNDNFIQKGYAVYIGEYGATNKNNLQDRINWFHDFIKESRVYGMPCFLWDNGVWEVKENNYSEHYGYYNRYNQTWYFPEILDAIIEEAK